MPKQFGKTSVSRKIFMVCNFIILTGLSLICILPFINLLAISFSDKTSVAANAVSFWPVGFNTAAYKFILDNNQFLRALWISIQRTVLGVILGIVLHTTVLSVILSIVLGVVLCIVLGILIIIRHIATS